MSERSFDTIRKLLYFYATPTIDTEPYKTTSAEGALGRSGFYSQVLFFVKAYGYFIGNAFARLNKLKLAFFAHNIPSVRMAGARL